jgi:aminopeptidase N
MKTILFSLLLILSGYYASGQNTSNLTIAEDRARYESIKTLLKTGDYINAVQEMNKFILSYPEFGELYFYRGLARMDLNDFYGARKDFKQARWSGFKNEEVFIDSWISKEYMVKKMLKMMEEDVAVDSLRGYRPVITPWDTIQGALRPERSCFDVYFYDLKVKIMPETKSIEGSNRIFFKTTTDTKVIQIDLFPEYTVSSIKWKERDLKFTRNLGGIFIDLGEIIPRGSDENITVEYKGVPRVAPKPPWNGGFVWEKEKNRYYVGVACEQLGASVWWPCKDHLSDKPDSMRINLLVPSGYQGISNGNLRSETNKGDGFTDFEWFVSYPINSYNVTVYVGDFVNFNEQFTNSNGSYQIDYYVLAKNLEKAKKYYAQTKEILTIFEKEFGEYPFKKDGAGMVEAPFEGMEHQGAIAIGGGYGKSNNKREYWTKDYDYLVIHETAHEWWGNAVAIGDMADAWINEGFATYAESLFAEDKFGYPDYVRVIAANQKSILNIWPLVGEKNINQDTFIGNDIYNKGASMLNNLRCILNNDSLFKRIIKDFYERYKYKIVTTSDFTDLVKEYTKTDYSDFFKIFLYEADPPILSCNYKIDKNNNLLFTYRWTNVGKNFTMPFCVAVDNKQYIRLNGTSFFQTFRYEKAKTFFLPNESRYDKKLVPPNSFTYYWTQWPF